MQGYTIRKVQDSDAESVMAIFNHYVLNSFAAYPDSPLPLQAFAMLKNLVRNECFYVAATDSSQVVGFAMLKHFIPMKSFALSSEVSYFVDANHTGMGLGTLFFNQLLQDAKEQGVRTLLASISSHNEQSIEFHRKHGFHICGKLEKVGRKLDQDFDIIWMQKDI
ncbi:MAG TPA: N-acetyltransferase family protein [Candidatus Cloacimonadota bacterium]|nr:N-acetyltransferase family protein [Candidatus Cloacimonadota bacterium]HPT72207.1 N-acetyltransferase family protein [Candidatus Cloacimonadota bacterium]